MERIEREGRLDEWCADNMKYFADTFGKENIVAAAPASGRGNTAHTRHARPHRQGRAQAQETGGADEETLSQEADRHRKAVRRRYYDTAKA